MWKPSNRRRVYLYTSSAIVVGGLVYGGFIHQSSPDVGTLISCAQFQIAMGLTDQAVPFVDQILEIEPDSHEGLMLRAAILEKREDWEGAAGIYEDLLPRVIHGDMRSELRIAIARIRHRQKRFAEALSALESVTEGSNEVLGKAHVVRCWIQRDLGRLEEARAEYHAARKLFRENWNPGELPTSLGLPPEGVDATAPESPDSPAEIQVPAGQGR